jgi:hypothetical protein
MDKWKAGTLCLPRARGFTYHLAMTALAKTDRATGQTRSLIGHSLDVAHCVHAMLTRGVARERLGMAAGIVLTDVHAARLAVLAGLHDMGKSTNGFQDRIHGRGRGTGHVAEAVAVVNAQGRLPDAVRSALRADMINDWCDDPESVLYAIFCHHGEPVPARASTRAHHSSRSNGPPSRTTILYLKSTVSLRCS